MFEVKNEAGGSTIYLYGPIGAAWDGVSDKEFARVFNAVDGDSATLRINSEGGDVFAGMAMYNLIRDSGRTVNVKIDGLAASAASLVAMAGDTVTMGRESLMMIHEPYSFAVGDFREMERTAASLQKVRKQLADAYAERSGASAENPVSPEAFLEKMTAETWYDPAEAVAEGLADGVAGEPDGDSDTVANHGRINSSRYVVVGFKRVPSSIRGHYKQPPPEELEKAITMRLQTIEFDSQLARLV